MQTIKETIEWRLIAIAITFAITYFWTGKLIEATGLTVALNLTKTIAFYLWRKIRLGHINKHSFGSAVKATFASLSKIKKGHNNKHFREEV